MSLKQLVLCLRPENNMRINLLGVLHQPNFNSNIDFNGFRLSTVGASMGCSITDASGNKDQWCFEGYDLLHRSKEPSGNWSNWERPYAVRRTIASLSPSPNGNAEHNFNKEIEVLSAYAETASDTIITFLITRRMKRFLIEYKEN